MDKKPKDDLIAAAIGFAAVIAQVLIIEDHATGGHGKVRWWAREIRSWFETAPETELSPVDVTNLHREAQAIIEEAARGLA